MSIDDKFIYKKLIGARQEGVRPKLPDNQSRKTNLHSKLPRKKGGASEYPPTHSGALGPRRELTKELTYLKEQVNYKHASPEQIIKEEKCDTCIYWKDGGACQIVLGYIGADMWCDKWEKSELLQKALANKPLSPVKELKEKTVPKGKTVQPPSIHSHRDDHPTHIEKEGDGGGEGGGFGEGGGTVFTSTNSGIFNPTHGGSNVKPRKKKTGIERLGQFITENSPEKKMVKDNPLTKMLYEVILELRKDDEKRQTPPNSKPTQDDPPQVVERESNGATEDGDLVTEQDNTTQNQKKIIEQDKNKDSTDSTAILNAWNSGGADIDSLHRGGKKDELEPDEGNNDPEELEIPEDVKRKEVLAKTYELQKGGLDFFDALAKTLDTDI